MKLTPQPPKQAAAPGPAPFAVVLPMVQIRTPDGIILKPGKALEWVTPLQFGTFFGVSRSSVYRWKEDSTIPKEFIKRAGKRGILIHAAAVEATQAKFNALAAAHKTARCAVKRTDRKKILNTV